MFLTNGNLFITKKKVICLLIDKKYTSPKQSLKVKIKLIATLLCDSNICPLLYKKQITKINVDSN